MSNDKHEISRLYDLLDRRMQRICDLSAELQQERERAERAEAALHRIVRWGDAYPIDIFPEPDFQKARVVLEREGITLDSISASNMRHVITRAGQIARGALQETEHD